jgi:beta-glucosidase
MSDIERRIDALLVEMTLEEKAALTVGQDQWQTRPIERLGLPSIWMADGPTGLRKSPDPTQSGIGTSVPATCFPTESALAASWDVELVEEVARAIARESQTQGVQVLLGPGVNLKRSPLAGRNFEYFSEDPVLSGELAAAYIRGLQVEGVGACLKHFVANEHETGRMYADSVVDERTLHEVYLRPFEIAIRKANPWSLMGAYNRLNGVYCCENRSLLHDIAKRQWGYDGVIISDWMAVNDRVAALDVGLHLQMPLAPTVDRVVAALRDGSLSETRLDEVLRDLLTFTLRADEARRPGATADLQAHHELARRTAAECIVLLKNEDALLPLDSDRLDEIALIGAFAQSPRFQGAGSSEVVPTHVESAHEALISLVRDNTRITCASGYSLETDAPDEALVREAQVAARNAQVAFIFVGLPGSYETEGIDRRHLDLPAAHNALVEAVLQVQPRTVVVLTNGAAVAMPWAARVPAIVEGWLAGQAGGAALVDVLLGRVNPSGKLAETFPVRLEDTPAFGAFPGDGTGETFFTERLLTGYRWYDARHIAPLFPFGHGLSYTTFEYRDLATAVAGASVSVTLRVRNIGTRAGKEVVQLYVRERSPQLQRPERELRAFTKLALDAGEETQVRFALEERDFATWDPRAVGGWRASPGEFEILVGASSRDIRLRATVRLEQTTPVPLRLGPLTPLASWLEHPAAHGTLAPAVAALAARFGSDGSELSPMMQAVIDELPLSRLVMLGLLSDDDLEGLLAEVNEPVIHESGHDR